MLTWFPAVLLHWRLEDMRVLTLTDAVLRDRPRGLVVLADVPAGFDPSVHVESP